MLTVPVPPAAALCRRDYVTTETENGARRTTVEIQVQHLAADVQFAAEVKKADAGDSGSAENGPAAASEEKQSA